MASGEKATRSQTALGIFTLLIAAVVLVGVAAGLWYGVKKAPPAISLAVLGAGTTVAVSTLTLTLGRVFERKKTIEAKQRESWAAMYEAFIRNWVEYMGLSQAPDKRKKPTPEAAAKFMADFSAQAMIWASDRVLTEFVRLRQPNETDTDADPLVVLKNFERLILAMRKDLGHEDKDLAPTALLQVFINDWPAFASTSSPAVQH
jgi:hypothetical protein